MAQNIGTLVTAAIRPNDSNDPIASAFASEIKGGLHTANTINDRDSIIFERRDWGMLCYVIDEDKTYQLKYGHVTTNIMDSSNWVEYSGSGGGGSNEWLDSVVSVAYQPPATYSVGDRFLAGKSSNDSLLGDWVSFNPGVVLEWNSVSWVLTQPSNGASVRVDNEDNSIYRYEGNFPTGAWYKEMLGQIRSMDATSINGQSYIASSLPPFDNYVKDMLFLTKFDTVNSGATVSININSLGTVPVKKPSPTGLISLVAGDIVPDITYSLVYNGSVFELIKHYTGDNALNIKYYIEPSDHVVVPPYHQYWVYGNLTIDGQMTNYGQVIIANGSLVNSNNFFNYGTVSFIQFNAGTASPSSNLSVGDYDANLTFTNITSIRFRGGSVTTPTGPADSVRVTGDVPNEVIVWIPAPDYVDNFTPSLFNGSDRKVTNPTVNSYTMSVVPGNFDIGNWTPGNTVKATNDSSIVAFSDTEMACLNQNTTMDFILYGADNTTIIDSMIDVPLNSSNQGLTSSLLGGLSINIQNFLPDSDRFKVDVTGTINLSTILPNGGRFGFLVRHNNSTDVNSPYEFTRTDKFSDNDYDPSSSQINGIVTIDEDVPSLNYVSGVAFYKQGSTFITSVFNMDNLNDMSYPTTTQLSLTYTNMNTTNKNLLAGASGYVNWTTNWDVQNVDFIKSYPTDSNSSIPGLTNDNDLNLNNLSNVNAKIYDWSQSDIQISQDYKFMFYNPTAISDRNTEDFVNESRRLKVKDALNSGLQTPFNSITDTLNNSTSGGDWELQQLFGRLVYPKIDFTPWGPNYNANNNINYSSLTSTTGVSITVIDNINTLSTISVTHTGYRWYLRRFETLNAGFTMANGVFDFDTDFSESDLITTNTGTTGNSNLLLYMGLTNNALPDKWYDLSKYDTSSPIQGPRTNGTGAGSNNLDLNSNIEWNTKTIAGWTCYILIGIKSTALTKEITQINLTNGSWN